MINIQPEQLAPDIVSISMLMCGDTFSRPIALHTAAQKQNGHVIRGAPYRGRQTGRETGRLCMFKWRQGVRFGSCVFTKWCTSLLDKQYRAIQLIHANFTEKLTLAGRELTFLWKVVKHQAQSLNGSFSILTTSWNYVNPTVLRRKKSLIGSVKINKVTPSERSTVVYSLIMLCTETSIVLVKRAALSPALMHWSIIIISCPLTSKKIRSRSTVSGQHTLDSISDCDMMDRADSRSVFPV